MWKVLVQEGDVLKAGQTAIILEAMKMEVNINVGGRLAGATVVKTLIQPGDTVDSGAKVILVRLANADSTA